MNASRKLILNAFLMGVGYHEAAWRHPSTDPRSQFDVTYWQRLAQTAERGRMHAVFLSDTLSAGPDIRRGNLSGFDPMILMTAMALTTRRIGLIATLSTSHSEPWNVARAMSTLDHVSGGRAGWNIVTSGSQQESENFGPEGRQLHADRYARAADFVAAVTAVWDAWQEGDFSFDSKSGVFADLKSTATLYRGNVFSVGGPLPIPRSPQGRPLLVQAGASDVGRAFAARHAEAVFTASTNIQDGAEFRSDIRSRAAKEGRDPDRVKVLPGLVPIIAATEAEARRLEEELAGGLNSEFGLSYLSSMVGVDMSTADLDAPMPELPPLAEVQGNRSRHLLIKQMATRGNLTVRQVLARLGASRGHAVVVGTAKTVADTLEEWLHSEAADGFNIMPPVLPSGLESFVDEVIPILAERNIFQDQYRGATLRASYLDS